MTRGSWTFHRTEELQAAIDDLEDDPVLQRAVERDIQKLESRGVHGARAPKFCQLEGGVWYIRIQAGNSMFRIYYFRNGPRSFCGFYGFKKSEQKLKGHVKKTIMDTYELLAEEGGCE